MQQSVFLPWVFLLRAELRVAPHPTLRRSEKKESESAHLSETTVCDLHTEMFPLGSLLLDFLSPPTAPTLGRIAATGVWDSRIVGRQFVPSENRERPEWKVQIKIDHTEDVLCYETHNAPLLHEKVTAEGSRWTSGAPRSPSRGSGPSSCGRPPVKKRMQETEKKCDTDKINTTNSQSWSSMWSRLSLVLNRHVNRS